MKNIFLSTEVFTKQEKCFHLSLTDLSSLPRPAAALGDRKEPEFVTDQHSLQHYHTGASPALTGGGGRYALPPCQAPATGR